MAFTLLLTVSLTVSRPNFIARTAIVEIEDICCLWVLGVSSDGEDGEGRDTGDDGEIRESAARDQMSLSVQRRHRTRVQAQAASREGWRRPRRPGVRRHVVVSGVHRRVQRVSQPRAEVPRRPGDVADRHELGRSAAVAAARPASEPVRRRRAPIVAGS